MIKCIWLWSLHPSYSHILTLSTNSFCEVKTMSNTYSPLAGRHSWWPCLRKYHHFSVIQAVTTVASNHKGLIDNCRVGWMTDWPLLDHKGSQIYKALTISSPPSWCPCFKKKTLWLGDDSKITMDIWNVYTESDKLTNNHVVGWTTKFAKSGGETPSQHLLVHGC